MWGSGSSPLWGSSRSRPAGTGRRSSARHHVRLVAVLAGAEKQALLVVAVADDGLAAFTAVVGHAVLRVVVAFVDGEVHFLGLHARVPSRGCLTFREAYRHELGTPGRKVSPSGR